MFNGSITLYCPSNNSSTTGSSNNNGLSSEFYAMLGLVVTTVITSVVSLVVALCTKHKTSKDNTTFFIGEIKRSDGTTISNVSITLTDEDEKKWPAKKRDKEPFVDEDPEIGRQPSSITGAEATHIAETGGIEAIRFLDRFCGNSEWQKHAISSDGRTTLDTTNIAGQATVHVDE